MKENFLSKKALTKIQIAIIAVIVVIAVVVGVTYWYTYFKAPPLPPKEKVIIGCSLPLSGVFGPACTIEIPPAIRMIVDEYNEKGGIYLPEYGKRLPS
ncbi:MAG: hypothetical protein QXX99_04410 [Candidatus Bathyarchaeia archaeon]